MSEGTPPAAERGERSVNPYASPASDAAPPGVNPYASPRTDEAPPARYEYVPLGRRAGVLTVFLGICLFSAVVSTVSTLLQIRLVSAVLAGAAVGQEALTANDLRQGIIGVFHVATLLAAAIAFCVWMHRAHKNLLALGASGLSYTPGWAAGAFFVPILNLFRPYQVAVEIWVASDNRDYTPRPGLLPLWWGLWISSNLVGQVSFRLSNAARTPGDILVADYVDLGFNLVYLTAAVLAIRVVRGITARQEACWQAR